MMQKVINVNKILKSKLMISKTIPIENSRTIEK